MNGCTDKAAFALEAQRMTAGDKASPRRIFGMAKILAIDDRVDNLIIVSALLRNLIPGCFIITAESGAEGIERTRIESPDTILLDIRMPGMDGFEVCRRLKSDPETRNIPIIMLTAIDRDSESRIKGLDMGADAFLTKPVDSGELAAQVRAMLRIKRAEDSLRRQRDELDRLVRDRTRALRSTEWHYKTLFNSANDALFIQDPDGHFLEANEEACKRFNYSVEELLKMTPADLDAPEYRALLPARLAELRNKGHAIFTTTHVTRDGRRIPTEISSKWIEYDGKPYLFSVARDISERVQAEKERESLEAQVRQGQKMEAIGTLAGGIAHDFNNILAAIMGYTELAMTYLSSDHPALADLEQVYRAGKRAKDLVQQILTFSRQSDMEAKPVQVHLIVKEVIRLMRASLPSTITIFQKLDPKSGAVKADPTQIHQIVMNLCTNAYHAMKEKGGVLEVTLDPFRVDGEAKGSLSVMKEGDYIRLTVGDTGQGMDEEVLDRIFDPFFTTKERGEGTGMGLSVVHGIVTACGGFIKVSSTPGAGSTFEVYFPGTDEQERKTTEAAHSSIRGGEHILLIDDEESLVQMNEELLERLGYKVTAATSSVKALEVFRSKPDGFDIIVTDQTMPQITGLELSAAIKRIRRDIPVILCTGFSESITPERVEASGVREVLFKPFANRELARIIRKVLDEE
jgi:PAS domain S-box-containing protein